MSHVRGTSYTDILKKPPHKDITKTNKFIMSHGFLCGADLLMEFVSGLGYVYSRQLALNYINQLKKQFECFCENRKDESDMDYFYDVGGTPLFNELIELCDSEDFYAGAVKFNPEFNFSGELSTLKRKAFRALKQKEFKDVGQGVEYFSTAIEMALKKIGVNPNEEIGGISKAHIMTLLVTRDIGGMQFYLPKWIELERIINRVDIFIDGYRMDYRDIVAKYKISHKSVSLINKKVREAIKEYDGDENEIK